MIEALETLEALAKYKTMTTTATALRVTQSSVSKRIASLEAYTGKKLIEKDGRRVIITTEGHSLLSQAIPHLIGLKEAIKEKTDQICPRVNIGFSESILSSWGAKALSYFGQQFKACELMAHAHRSPVVIDKVRSGEYSLGICAGFCHKAPDLYVKKIGYEKMVLITNAGANKNLSLMTIEETSETWPSIEKMCKRENIHPMARLESFTAMAQMANFGLVNALIPAGVAKYFCKKKLGSIALPIKRPIVMVGRKTTFTRPDLEAIREGIEGLLQKEIEAINNSFH